VVDQRTLLGAPLWVKPLKFAISFAVYSGTLAWMLARLPDRRMHRTGWLIVVTSAIEVAIIVGQAARGVRSHFNDDDAVGETLFILMGVTIVFLYVATFAVALRFLREPGDDPATTWAVRLGLLVSLLGMSIGFVMSAIGSHAVGVPDGGAGLPFTNWSTTGGDLRIGHFVGLHALQLLPLLAAGLTLLRPLDVRARTQVVQVAAAGYAALVLLVTWQALRAQPLLAPDALTLAVLAVVPAATAAALVTVLRGTAGRRATRSRTLVGV
jgi:hypothetical protein